MPSTPIGRSTKFSYCHELSRFLTNRYQVNIQAESNNPCTFRLPTGSIIYANGANEQSKWYDLQKKRYDRLVIARGYYAVIVGTPETTYVFPYSVLPLLFPEESMKREPADAIKENRWFFNIVSKDGGKSVWLSTNRAFNILPYLNKWEQIPDFEKPIHSNRRRSR